MQGTGYHFTTFDSERQGTPSPFFVVHIIDFSDVHWVRLFVCFFLKMFWRAGVWGEREHLLFLIGGYPTRPHQ